MQTKINKTKTEQTSKNFRKEFESIKSIDVQPTKRIVTLVYKSCCGCGCNDISIEREVPFDSSLRNGDRTHELLSTDKSV